MPDLAAHHRARLGRATIGDQLRRHARTQPNKCAIVSYDAVGERSGTSYGELNQRANRYALLILTRGVPRGGRVASMTGNRVDAVPAYYGALKIGAAFTGINVLYREGEVFHQLTHCAAEVVLADTERAPILSDAAPETVTRLTYGAELDALLAEQPDAGPDAEVDENDVALLVYTSGTEAAPKGVLIPHRNYLTSTVRPGDGACAPAPTTCGCSSCRFTPSPVSAP